MNETYRWCGSTENLLRHGAGSPVTLLVLPALFEEANRMRRFTVTVMRYLAAKNIETILPDLPGTGESEVALQDVLLPDWQDAVAGLSGSIGGTVAFRGGALLDGAAERRWQLAPDTGQRLLRDLVRATAISNNVSPAKLDQQARTSQVRLAGNLISPDLYLALADATPRDDAHITRVSGPKLWRAAEPIDDPAFAELVAEDITTWVRTCAAS